MPLKLQKYDILKTCDLPNCHLSETPKDKKYFEKVSNLLLVSADTALAAMQEKAEDLGWEVKIWSHNFQGLAKELGG